MRNLVALLYAARKQASEPPSQPDRTTANCHCSVGVGEERACCTHDSQASAACADEATWGQWTGQLDCSLRNAQIACVRNSVRS
jgi:hypothetical protein